MLNTLLNSKFDQSDVISLMEGHNIFLNNNVGRTDNAALQHYVFNPEYILSNNRHFIAATQMEAQPNGDATTEGQSLQIIGFCYAYMATGDQKYLDWAIKTFDAYIEHFYAGQPIPTSPQRYICNWLCNGKEPVLANWPVDFEFPTHSGFKGQLMTFTNGQCKIPRDAPYWGQYLDKATFAFDGALAWDSIVGGVKGVDANGDIDWNSNGIQYDVDWLINLNGDKIDWDGNKIGSGFPESDKGTVQLKDTGVQGQHKLNWGNRQPVEHGGYMLQRNEVWHNRPLVVPVATDRGDGTGRAYGQMGNASDAEQWFADAAYLMYQITNDTKYWTVWQCVIKTVNEYSDIDSTDKFFRKELGSNTPWTDGISYDYCYPSDLVVKYIRNTDGYISASVTGAGSNTIEQQAVWFKTNRDSKIRTTVGGIGNTGGGLTYDVRVKVAVSRDEDEANWTTWKTSLPYRGNTINAYDIPLGNFLQLEGAGGEAFILADDRSIVTYGSAVNTMQFEDNVFDSRSSQISKCTLPSSGDGLIIGFWLLDDSKADPTSIVWRSNIPVTIEITDDNGWFWHWAVPSTGDTWQNIPLPRSGLVLSTFQQNPGTILPTAPVYTKVKQLEINQVGSNPAGVVSWYAVNSIPQVYNLGERYVMTYSLDVRSTDTGFVYNVGDCTVIDYIGGDLFCTPGVIPFSNIYTEGSQQFDGWHGMPYPGYQYPFVYMFNPQFKGKLNNMIEFMYQSQQWYYQKFGVLGPGASAYIWNRWDNYKYGTPDTWTMYHWGTDHAWAGYQPRAYCGAARAWYELVINGDEVPEKLKIYVENWTKFMYDTMVQNGGYSMTDMLTDGTVVCDPTDFTGHMCGLFLSGAVFSYLAGSEVPGIENFIELLVGELVRNYHITDIPNHVMNGSWSPGLRLDTGSGPESNGMFFGFWSGEILRGLGLYLIYKRLNPGENMYQQEV